MPTADDRGYAVRPLVDVPDPERVARALAETGHAWCWLDGAAAAERGDPRGTTYLGATTHVRTAQTGREHEFLEQFRGTETDAAGRGRRGFAHGWVTAFGYEFGVALLGAQIAVDDAAPAFALRLDAVLAIDHRGQRAEVRGASEADIEQWMAAYGHVLGGRDPASGSGASAAGGPRPLREHQWRTDAVDYETAVDACRRAIGDGDAYVLCLTDTAEVALPPDTDPVELYRTLRANGGALRGGIVAAGDRVLISASPERFLSVTGDRVDTHPIKGTRKRGSTPAEDDRIAAELAAHPKERAENLMIVDLMRNDLSRVCAPGSVGVDGFLRVEAHPHVHQLVSTVFGRLRSGADATDALAAAFPGGSMTGAPKRSAVEILGRLEGRPRGLYSGCFGWIGSDGSCELAMTIRGVELRGSARDGGIDALVGAGGGITIDSDPSDELAEQRLKADAILRALGSR